jgi:hypothetical protein
MEEAGVEPPQRMEHLWSRARATVAISGKRDDTKNGSNRPKPLPPVAGKAMVRRGSTVRVRQRAWPDTKFGGCGLSRTAGSSALSRTAGSPGIVAQADIALSENGSEIASTSSPVFFSSEAERR